MKIKYLAVLFALLLNLFCSVSYAEVSVPEILSKSEEYGLVSAISDVEELIPFSYEGTVKRSDFIKAAVNVFKAEKNDSVKLSFRDVSNSDKALTEALYGAVSCKMVSDGEVFRPDEPVLYNEAVKICIAGMGYMVKAEAMGGYPGGYARVASLTGLTDGVSEEITAKSAYKLFFNALNADMLLSTGVSGYGETSYASDSDTTILENLYKIKYTRGIMNANEIGAIGQPDFKGRKGYVKINDKSYKTEKDINSYLGYNLSVYYVENESGGTEEIFFVHPYKTETVVLRNRDAYYSDGKITWEDNGRERVLRVENGFDYIYNGKPFYGYNNSEIIPKDGEITAIDNDSDGIYEVISATEYMYIEATSVNKLEEIIYDKRGEQYTVDGGKYETLVSVTDETGSEILLGEIAVGSILAVKATKDKTAFEITVLENSVSGVLKGINTEKYTFLIDEAEYEISYDFYKNRLNTVSLGSEYNFALGMYNEIIMISSFSGELDYGFLTRTKKSTGISEKITAEIYTKTGKFIKAVFAEKMTVDGSGGLSPDEALRKITAAETEQLIKYSLNADGELKRVDTATPTTELFASESDNAEDSLRKFEFNGTLIHRTNCFYPYFFRGSAIVFKIPKDVTEENLFSIGATFGSYQRFENNEIVAYDIGSGGTPKAIVYRSSAATNVSDSNDSIVLLVEKVVDTLNSEGTASKKVYGWLNGNFGEYFIDDGIVYKESDFTPGNILRISLVDDTISNYVLDFDFENMELDASTNALGNVADSTCHYQLGKVYTAENGYAYISNTKNPDGSYNFDLENLICVQLPQKAVMFNSKNKTIRSADSGNIKTARSAGNDASFVVIKQHYLYSEAAVIYTAER